MNNSTIGSDIRRKKYFKITQGNIELEKDGSVIKKDNTEKEKNQFFANVNLASELGFVIAIPLVGGVILGTYLDKTFDSEPKFTLSCIFFGVFLSLYNI